MKGIQGEQSMKERLAGRVFIVKFMSCIYYLRLQEPLKVFERRNDTEVNKQELHSDCAVTQPQHLAARI